MSYEKSRIVIMFFVIVFALNVLIASEPNNKVIAITDGDTIKVLFNKQEVKIRLAGIDAPERNQPFGSKAKERLAELCFNKPVIFNDTKKDRYGRILSKVYVGKVDVCAEMIKSGMAWQYTDYDKSVYLKKLQEKAKSEKIGLWANKNPISPWEWRKNKTRRLNENYHN